MSGASNRRKSPCPLGDECALNHGAVHCFGCHRNWPPDKTWVRRRWRCFREGHIWLDEIAALIGGANVCKHCGRLVDW